MEIRVGFPGESQLRQSRATQPCVHAECFSIFIINSGITYGIFSVRTDVNACDADTVRQSALKVDSGRKIPCRNGKSNPCRRRAGPMLYQLKYDPTNPQA